jgi:HEAT repeat protein
MNSYFGHGVMDLADSLTTTQEFQNPQVKHLTACEAALVLARSDRTKALQILVTLARDGDPTIRVRAAECLMEVGGDRAVMALLDLCDDHNPKVRLTALGALGVLRIHSASEKILQLCKSDPEISVRVIAARTLGKLGSYSGLPLILPMLDANNEYYRRLAVMALQDIINQRFSPTPEGVRSARRYLEMNKNKYFPGG